MGPIKGTFWAGGSGMLEAMGSGIAVALFATSGGLFW